MANRMNTTTDHTKLNRQNAAINFSSKNLSSAKPKENPRFDDLIVSLTNAHENRRARQVTEWERMSRYNVLSVS